jgi:hypothetical protein
MKSEPTPPIIQPEQS